MALARKSTPSRDWTTWTGNLEEFRGVYERTAQLCERRRDALLEAMTPLPEGSASWERDRFARDQETIRQAFEVKAVISYPEDSVEGTWDDVVKELDRRHYTSIEFRARTLYGEEFVSLTFTPFRGQSAPRPGVDLAVRSADRGWAAQVVAEVTDEVERGTPPWGWLYTFWGSWLFGLLVTWTIGLVAYVVARAAGVEPPWRYPLAVTVGIIGMAVLQQNRAWLQRKLVPPVELLAEGQAPRGTRALLGTLTVILLPALLTILLAVLLPNL